MRLAKLSNIFFRQLVIVLLAVGGERDILSSSSHAQIPAEAYSDESLPSKDAWRVLPDSEREMILDLLIVQTRSNYEKIKTWQGMYSVEQETLLNAEYVARNFKGRVEGNSNTALIQQMRSTVDFVLDVENDAIRRQRIVSSLRFLMPDSRTEVVVNGVGHRDANSIVNNEHYIFCHPTEVATYAELPTFPEAQNKRAARRVEVARAANQHFGELMDPRFLFSGINIQAPNWEALNWYLTSIKGSNGRENQEIANRLQVAVADKDGQSWYQVTTELVFGDGDSLKMGTIWSPLAGYNPVLLVMWNAKTGKLSRTATWHWKLVEGVYLPDAVEDKTFSESGEIERSQAVKLQESTLNAPVPASEFSYEAIGLADGDLVIDEIDRTVSVLKNGQPSYLANFGQTYIPLAEHASLSRWAIMLVNIFAVIALTAFIVVKKRRRL